MSLVRRRRTQMLATIAATAAAAAGSPAAARQGPAATAYELERARLGEDLRRLKGIQSIEAKIEKKRELLPQYAPWVQGVLDAEAAGAGGVQDDILVQVMIWRIDVGDFEGALSLIVYALRYALPLPDRFTSTTPTMIVENIAEAAIKQIGQGEDFDFGLLLKIAALTAEQDMHDQVRAKLKKAMGLQLARVAAVIEPGGDGPAGGKRAALEEALRYLRRALELNDKVGVKKDIERLDRELRQLAEAN